MLRSALYSRHGLTRCWPLEEITVRTYIDLRTGERLEMWHEDAVYAVRVLGWLLVDRWGYWADSAI